ncbi:MAG: peptidoglycan-binding protein, partial [Pseudomonadota bacterium]
GTGSGGAKPGWSDRLVPPMLQPLGTIGRTPSRTKRLRHRRNKAVLVSLLGLGTLGAVSFGAWPWVAPYLTQDLGLAQRFDEVGDTMDRVIAQAQSELEDFSQEEVVAEVAGAGEPPSVDEETGVTPKSEAATELEAVQGPEAVPTAVGEAVADFAVSEDSLESAQAEDPSQDAPFSEEESVAVALPPQVDTSASSGEPDGKEDPKVALVDVDSSGTPAPSQSSDTAPAEPLFLEEEPEPAPGLQDNAGSDGAASERKIAEKASEDGVQATSPLADAAVEKPTLVVGPAILSPKPDTPVETPDKVESALEAARSAPLESSKGAKGNTDLDAKADGGSVAVSPPSSAVQISSIAAPKPRPNRPISASPLPATSLPGTPKPTTPAPTTTAPTTPASPQASAVEQQVSVRVTRSDGSRSDGVGRDQTQPPQPVSVGDAKPKIIPVAAVPRRKPTPPRVSLNPPPPPPPVSRQPTVSPPTVQSPIGQSPIGQSPSPRQSVASLPPIVPSSPKVRPARPERSVASAAREEPEELTLLAEIQLLLRALDIEPGRVDGTMNRQTVRAIRTYQDFAGLAVTGKADQTLLEDLRSVAGLMGQSVTPQN